MSARPATRRSRRRISTSPSAVSARRGSGGTARRSIPIRCSRHPLQPLRRLLQRRIELERRLVLLLRVSLAPLLLVDRAEPVMRVGQRRLAFLRRVAEVLLQCFFPSGEVRTGGAG